MTRFLFLLSILFILYVYAGYPLLIWLWARFFPRRISKSDGSLTPRVSVLISAYNEEKRIADRIENLLAQDYPADRMEIIVVSDGSTDGTDRIVRELIDKYSPEGASRPLIRLISFKENRGKPSALNAGFELSSGDFIVFADARQQFEPGAVRELIGNFSDPSVGVASGELLFHEDSDTSIKAEMGLYWNMEKWIRKTESRIHSAAGATGAIYAIRRDLFEPLPEDLILDDVLVPMRAVFKGYRTIFDSRARAWDVVSENMAQEKRRKVRTLLGNYQIVQIMPELLSPRRNPIFIQFLSHKLLRLTVPFFFIMLMISAIFSGEHHLRVFFIIVAALGLLPLLEKHIKGIPVAGRLLSISKTFISLNWFALLAFLRFIRPGGKDVW